MKIFRNRLTDKNLCNLKRRMAKPGRRGTDAPSPTDPALVGVLTVNLSVGWFLGDHATWRRLRKVYVVTRREKGEPSAVVRLPVPPLPPGAGLEWKKIFETVYHEFRRAFAVYGEDDPWVSYSLSYAALCDCARRGRHYEMAYVHKACVNRHKRFRKRLMKGRYRERPVDGLEWAGVSPEPADLMIDLEEVLRRMPARDAAVCRMRLIDRLTFQEIGKALGIDASTACRCYDRQIVTIRAALRDYGDEAADTVPPAAPSESRIAAA